MTTIRKSRVEAQPERIASTAASTPTRTPLHSFVRTLLRNYFDDLSGHQPANLYNMVIQEVEEPLLETVMEYAGGNQTKAARILGINRSTLRKKLGQYGLNK